MQKLTDQEFNTFASALGSVSKHPSKGNPGLSAGRKLLANYQEQLEAESYVAAERYTEANACTTTVDCDLFDLRAQRPEGSL